MEHRLDLGERPAGHDGLCHRRIAQHAAHAGGIPGFVEVLAQSEGDGHARAHGVEGRAVVHVDANAVAGFPGEARGVGRERGGFEGDSREFGRTEFREQQLAVYPGGAHYFERRFGAASDRYVGGLKQGDSRVQHRLVEVA